MMAERRVVMPQRPEALATPPSSRAENLGGIGWHETR